MVYSGSLLIAESNTDNLWVQIMIKFGNDKCYKTIAPFITSNCSSSV